MLPPADSWATVPAVRREGDPGLCRRRASWPSRLLLVALACAVAAVSTAGASATHAKHARHLRVRSTPATLPLRTAIFDPFLLPGPQQDKGFQMTRAAGASYVRILVRWSTIAPKTVPTGFVPTNPSSPGYSWATTDAAVASAEAAGLTPIIDIISPPTWGADVGGINPQIAALGQFATAIATHYDGHHGASAAHVFQVWNEPNLSLDLNPVDASVYRSMVNAVAASVHAVNPANLVVAGDLDPFANTAKRFHTEAPLAFMRSLLCLSTGKKPHATCNTPVDFDVWSHHPYTFQGPFGHAKNADDVSLGDLPRMDALLQDAVKLHTIASSHPVQFWVTEFGWDTSPPRSHAAPLQLQARWTAEALYQMWHSGVSLVTWFLLQDQASPSPWECGLYFNSPQLEQAKAKPMRTSFRFPFVAYLGSKTVSVWGRDATSTKKTVTIQLKHPHGKWKTVARLGANHYGIFLAKLRLKATKKDWLRATASGSGYSLPFSLTRPPSTLRYDPWGK